jgi:hypothetical protein
MTEHERRQFPKRRFLGVLLALAFMQALLYALVIPPWQAPDETGHFEYARLIAELGHLPSSKDISPTFERELVSSLYEWRYGEFIGRPLLEQMPVRMHELPIYIFARRSRTILGRRFSLAYLWQALFLMPLRHQDMLMQLYVARLSQPLCFQMPSGREKTVLWATVLVTSVTFPYPCLRLVDIDGDVFEPINDGDCNWDWDEENGQIALGVYENMPFYVEPCR